MRQEERSVALSLSAYELGHRAGRHKGQYQAIHEFFDLESSSTRTGTVDEVVVESEPVTEEALPPIGTTK
eukprot:6806048-Prorocentrum_lima.AAC.1